MSPIRPSRTTLVSHPPNAEQLAGASWRRSPILPPDSPHTSQLYVIPNLNPATYQHPALQEAILNRVTLQQTIENLDQAKSSPSKRSPIRPPESAILPNLPRSTPVNLTLPDPAKAGPAKSSQVKRKLPESPQDEPEPPRAGIATQQTTTLTHAESALLPSPRRNEQSLVIAERVSEQDALYETADAEETIENSAQDEDLSRSNHSEPHGRQESWARRRPRGARSRRPSSRGPYSRNRRKRPTDQPSRSPIAPPGPQTPRRSERIRLLSQEPQTPRRNERLRLLSQEPQTPRRSERLRLLGQESQTPQKSAAGVAATGKIKKRTPAQIEARRQHLAPKQKTTAARPPTRFSVLDTLRAESSGHQNEAVQNALEILSRPEPWECSPLPTSAPVDLPQIEDTAQAERAKLPQVQTTENVAQGKERRKLRGEQENRSRSRQRSRHRSGSPSRTPRETCSRSPDSRRRHERSTDGRSRSPIAPPGRTRARGTPGDVYIRSKSWSPSFQSRPNRQQQFEAGQPRSIIPPRPTDPVPRPAYAPPPAEIHRDPIQRTKKGSQKKINRKASRQRDSDPRGRSRRRPDKDSSSSRSPTSRKRRKRSPPRQLLTRDFSPPGPEALFTFTRSPIRMQESSKDALQDINHNNILRQAGESSIPSNASDVPDRHESRPDILPGVSSPLAESLRRKLNGKADRSAARGLVDAADQFLLSPKPRDPNLQSSSLRSRPPVCPPGESSKHTIPNIPLPSETTREGSRQSSVHRTRRYRVPISSSDEESFNAGQATLSQAQPPIPSTLLDEGRQRRRSPIRPPGAYPSSCSSEENPIKGQGQSHIRRLAPSGSGQESAERAQPPKTRRALDLEHDDFSQTKMERAATPPSSVSSVTTDESEEL